MKKFLLTFLSIILTGSFAFTQHLHYNCGTEHTPEERARLLQNKKVAKDLNITKSGDISYVPITIHLVANTAGNGRIDEQPVLDNLCRLNVEFLDVGLQFYMPGEFNYIDNDAIYGGSASSFVIALNSVPGTINTFVGNQIPSQGGGITLGYYSPAGDYLHLAKTAIGGFETTNSFVFSHEMGHFFSMPHTFDGWDGSTVYVPGTPAPGSISGPSGTWAVEKAARTGPDANCDTAADTFCDTPPDYRFGFGWNGPPCLYNANALDPLGVPVFPQENNQMSYFFGCQERQFTDEQSAVMLADYAGRTFNDGTPDGDIDQDANLVSPVNTTVLFQNVVFDWDPVPNATKYLLEINRNSNFNPSFVVEEVYLTTNTYTSTLLSNNQTYYWRVKPMNNYDFCQGFSSTGTFMTGTPTSVNEIPGLSGFSVRPNPVSTNSNLQIMASSEVSKEVNLNLYNIHGQRIYTSIEQLSQGVNVYNINTGEVANGVYLLTIENSEGVARKKVIVTK
ncbi:MAG: T9SS type A sorting domain-containing protein [Bacteroidota bacterium]